MLQRNYFVRCLRSRVPASLLQQALRESDSACEFAVVREQLGATSLASVQQRGTESLLCSVQIAKSADEDEASTLACLAALRSRFPSLYKRAISDVPSLGEIDVLQALMVASLATHPNVTSALKHVVRCLTSSELVESIVCDASDETKFTSRLTLRQRDEIVRNFDLSATYPKYLWYRLYSESLREVDAEAFAIWRMVLDKHSKLTITPALNALGAVSLAASVFYGDTITAVMSVLGKEHICSVCASTDGSQPEVVHTAKSPSKKDAIRIASLEALELYFPTIFEKVKKLSWYTIQVQTPPKVVVPKAPMPPAAPATAFEYLQSVHKASGEGCDIRKEETLFRVWPTRFTMVEIWTTRANQDVACLTRFLATDRIHATEMASIDCIERNYPMRRNGYLSKDLADKDNKRLFARSNNTLTILRNAACKTAKERGDFFKEVCSTSETGENVAQLISQKDGVVSECRASLPIPRLLLACYRKLALADEAYCPDKIRAFLAGRVVHPLAAYDATSLETLCKRLLMFEYGHELEVRTMSCDSEWTTTAVLRWPENEKDGEEIVATEIGSDGETCLRVLYARVLFNMLPEVYTLLPISLQLPRPNQIRCYLPRGTRLGKLEMLRACLEGQTGQPLEERYEKAENTYDRFSITVSIGGTAAASIASSSSVVQGLYAVYDMILAQDAYRASRLQLDAILSAHVYDSLNRTLPEHLVECVVSYELGATCLVGTSMTVTGDVNFAWTTTVHMCGLGPQRFLLATATCHSKFNSVRSAAMLALETHFPKYYQMYSQKLTSVPMNDIIFLSSCPSGVTLQTNSTFYGLSPVMILRSLLREHKGLDLRLQPVGSKQGGHITVVLEAISKVADADGTTQSEEIARSTRNVISLATNHACYEAMRILFPSQLEALLKSTPQLFADVST